MDACTIIAKNYLAHARVLAESYQRLHPGSRFHVLIIDDLDGYVDPAAEPFEVVTPADLDIPMFERMAVIYDVLELSTAVKPWLLRWLLARSGGRGALYLDPDMLVLEPLEEVFERVERHGLVLCPHNLEPMPRDGKRPNEQDILIAGTYNLGFIGIGSGAFADELLDWWSVRLESDCIVDPERGFFVDQRWMDLVPAMAESFHLLRDPGFNVAYWNLPTRPVTRRDGRWWVKGDVPLRLFHFSGFDAAKPHLLSKHQDRIRLGDHPDLAALCAEYAELLLAAGADEVAAWPYTYVSTHAGIPLDRIARRFFRDLVVEGFEESVFSPRGEAEFVAAATAPADVGGERGVTRYLAAVHALRPDLQRAFPDLSGPDADAYLAWVAMHGREQIPLHDALLPLRLRRNGGPPAAAAPAPAGPPVPAAPRLGVNVVGYLRSELGVGEIGRQVIDALDTQNVPTLPVGVHAPLSRQGHAFADVDLPSGGFPLNLLCINADMLPAFAADAGPEFFAGRYTIGMWWWEVTSFPERWMGAFDHVEEVWAGSRFVADALSAVAPVPVVRVPTPVALPHVRPGSRESLGLPEGFLFMFMYDFNSVVRRKNPLGLLEAFLRAFPEPGAGASLALKSINAEHHPAEHEQVKVAAAAHEHVHLLDYYVTAADKHRLLASCDSYVSLHRSEGFGMTMAEAMLLGKPVVATGYSGNLDYMTEANSYLVRHELAPVGAGAGPYPADAEWAEPDLEHAAELLREVYEDRDGAAARARLGAEQVAARHSREAAGAAMATQLRRAHGALEQRAADRPDAVEHAQELIRRGSLPPGGARLGRLRRVPRKAALRLMKPYTAHEAQVDAKLAEGISELGEVVRRHEQGMQRQAAVEASLLHELRRLRAAVDEAATNEEIHARVDELASRTDQLRAELEHQGEALLGVDIATGLEVPEPDAPLPQAPAEPWSHEYNEAHATLIARSLNDGALAALLRDGGPLPDGYGLGFDERAVEFPWVMAQPLRGAVLDAGSTLNHLHVLAHVRKRVDSLHIVTLSPEERSFPQLGVSYLYADLRSLPFKDATYDRAVSISTLEHVGMDNAYYGAEGTAAADPQRECAAAVRELARVLRPGGELYLTVPVGTGERYAWVRSLAVEELDELVDAFGGSEAQTAYFRHGSTGWRRAGRDEVGDARYRDHFTAPAVGEDRLVAAEAVGCVRLVKPG